MVWVSVYPNRAWERMTEEICFFFFPIAVINFVLVYHPGKKHFPGGLNIFQTESGRRKKTPVVTKSI